MSIVMENMNVREFRHFDLWLRDRKARGVAPNIDLALPLAGYGHRMSLTSRKGPVFGGAWLPMESEAQSNAAIMDSSPPAVRAWVEACQRQRPGIKRGDPAPVQLECPHVSTCENLPCGIYDITASGQNHTEMRSHVSLALYSLELMQKTCACYLTAQNKSRSSAT